MKIFGFSTILDHYNTASTLTLTLYNLISVGLILSLPTYIITSNLGYTLATRKIYKLSFILLFLLIISFPLFYYLTFQSLIDIDLHFFLLYIVFCCVGFLQLNICLNNCFLVASKRNIIIAILFNIPNFLVLIFINFFKDFSLLQLSIIILFSSLLQFVMQIVFLRDYDKTFITSEEVLFGFKEIFLLSTPSLILCLSNYFEIIWSNNYGEGTVSIIQFTNRLIAASLTILVISQLNNNLQYFIKYSSISKFNRIKFLLFTVFAGIASFVFILFIILYFIDFFNINNNSMSALLNYLYYISSGIVFYVASVCLIKLLCVNISFYKIAIFLAIIWSLVYNSLNFIFNSESVFYLAVSYNISWFTIFLILSFLYYEKEFIK